MAKYAADRFACIRRMAAGTLGCGRMPYHKFDPYLTKDFTALPPLRGLKEIPVGGRSKLLYLRRNNRNNAADRYANAAMRPRCQLTPQLAAGQAAGNVKRGRELTHNRSAVEHHEAGQQVSRGGANSRASSDQSVLATGKNPAKDVIR